MEKYYELCQLVGNEMWDVMVQQNSESERCMIIPRMCCDESSSCISSPNIQSRKLENCTEKEVRTVSIDTDFREEENEQQSEAPAR